jgi:hypothetical protein
VKVKRKLSNFLVLFYMGSMIALPHLFGANFRLDTFTEFVGLIAAVALQIRFVSYETC